MSKTTIRIQEMAVLPEACVRSVSELLHALTFTRNDDPFCMASLVGKTIHVPRAWDFRPYLTPGDYRIVESYLFDNWPAVDFGEPQGSLGPNERIRYDQRPAWEALSTDPTAPFGRQLILGCGKGKTRLALQLMAQRRVPTVVVCHTLNMAHKWVAEAELHLGYPRDAAGFIGDGKLVWDRDFVVTTMAGLIAREMPREFWERFGLVIFDEGDLLGASQLSTILPKFLGERVLLTATPDRADGASVLFDAHIGPAVFRDVTPDLQPRCFVLESGLPQKTAIPVTRKRGKKQVTKTEYRDIQGTIWSPRVRRQIPNIPKTINNLSRIPSRTAWCLAVLSDVAIREKRKVLFLGERVDELKALCRMWQQRFPDVPAGLALGAAHMKAEQIQENLGACQVIFGIQQIAQRGLDESSIDTVIIQYACYAGINRLQQTIGRALRYREGKPEPWVFILNDRNVPVIHDKALILSRKLKDMGYSVEWEGT